MTTVQYVCTTTSRTLLGKLDQDAAWFDMTHVAHLFGIRPDRAAKLLWQVGTTGDIDAEKDIRRSDHEQCLLSHRAVMSVGYHVNFGRTTAFRNWCASSIGALRR
jgi:hypothetical protein